MSVKSVMRAVWSFLEDYDGDISCKMVDRRGGASIYFIETDGNQFDAVCYDDDPDIVFWRVEGESLRWNCTDMLPVVEVDGLPRTLPVPTVVTSPSDIAREAGVSIATVYNHAKKLGRLPTVAEIKASKPGRPKKY